MKIKWIKIFVPLIHCLWHPSPSFYTLSCGAGSFLTALSRLPFQGLQLDPASKRHWQEQGLQGVGGGREEGDSSGFSCCLPHASSRGWMQQLPAPFSPLSAYKPACPLRTNPGGCILLLSPSTRCPTSFSGLSTSPVVPPPSW